MFERRLLVAFLRATTVTLALLLVLIALLMVRRLAGNADLDPAAIAADATRLFSVALAVAGPLAIVFVIVDLKRSGVFAAHFAAGLPPRRVAGVLGIAALIMCVAALLAAEFVWQMEARTPDSDSVWSAQTLTVWEPPTHPGARYVFSHDRLDVWNAEGEALVGTSIEMPPLTRPPSVAKLLAPPPPSLWLQPTARGALILASAHHLATPGLLLLVCAGVALLLPVRRQGWAFAFILAALPIAGAALVWLTVALWAGSGYSYASSAAYWLGAAGLLIALYRWFDRRGLRA